MSDSDRIERSREPGQYARPSSPRPARKEPPRRRVPLLPLAAALLLLSFVLGGLVAAQRVVPPLPAARLQTLALSGPQVVADTWLSARFPDSQFDPSVPGVLFADAGDVELQFADGGARDRVLLRFDLDSLPEGATIEQARLRVHLETRDGAAPGVGPDSVDAYRVRRTWDAREATYDQPWSSPGLEPGPDHDVQPIGTRVVTGTGWLEFDVTTAAGDWYLFPASNKGLMLKISNAPAGAAHYRLQTTEHSMVALRPSLEVDYRLGPPSLRTWGTETVSGVQVQDTWLVSSLPEDSSAATLRGRPEQELRWLTSTYSETAGLEVLDVPFSQFPRLRINRSDEATEHVVFMFSTTEVPVEGRVEHARLELYLTPADQGPDPGSAPRSFPATVSVHNLLTSWDHETATFAFPWTQPGLVADVDYQAEPVASQQILGPTWVSLDVRSVVQEWHTARNDGLVLLVEEAPEGLAPYWVPSSEAPQADLRPRLYISYTLP